MKHGHWTYPKKFKVDDYFGFVYEITDMISGRRYIGKKQFHSYKKKKRYKESDWKTYTSSSKALNKDLAVSGKKVFKFKILRLYKTRGGLVYGEANHQHLKHVLTKRFPNSDVRMYYNGQIAGCKFIPKEY